MRGGPVLVEGHAALFGAVDLSGDTVRAGAFARSLRFGRVPAMLLQHRSNAPVGRWTRIAEDGRGLYVRGLVESKAARALLAGGLNGLSIGFRPRLWRPRPGRGRDLIDIELIEISLVAEPMQPMARLQITGNQTRRAA